MSQQESYQILYEHRITATEQRIARLKDQLYEQTKTIDANDPRNLVYAIEDTEELIHKLELQERHLETLKRVARALFSVEFDNDTHG